MKKLLAILIISVAGMSAYGDEWVSHVPYVTPASPMIVVTPVFYPVPVFYYPVVMTPQYVPVVVYQNVVVETRSWCLLKKFEIVRVPQTILVPMRY